MEVRRGLGVGRGVAAGGVHPAGKVRVLHQLLHLAALIHAESHLPQVLHHHLLAGLREEDLGGFHRAAHGGAEHRIRLRIGKPCPQVQQIGPALLAQGQIGSAAHVKAVQVALGQAMADEMQLIALHKKRPLF